MKASELLTMHPIARNAMENEQGVRTPPNGWRQMNLEVDVSSVVRIFTEDEGSDE